MHDSAARLTAGYLIARRLTAAALMAASALLAVGCAGGPGRLGITGPGNQPAGPSQAAVDLPAAAQPSLESLPTTSGDATVGIPGIGNPNNGYGPSVIPSTGPNGRYFGYN